MGHSCFRSVPQHVKVVVSFPTSICGAIMSPPLQPGSDTEYFSEGFDSRVLPGRLTQDTFFIYNRVWGVLY